MNQEPIPSLEPSSEYPQHEPAQESHAHKGTDESQHQHPDPYAQKTHQQLDFNSPAAEPKDDLSDAANSPSLAVVKALSVRGLEYLFMSICLWIGAVSLVWGLLLLVNDAASAQMLAFPATSLVVTLPVFAWFFIRLKKAEIKNPALRFDSSKRRLSQITQLVAFLASLFNVITFVYLVIASASGGAKVSLGKAFLNLIVILAVSGGILAYYWVDEHRSFKG